MSVWDNYQGTVTLPPGTPEIRIRRAGSTAEIHVYADGEIVHLAEQYPEAHRWCMNTYRLTSTMMLPVYDDYAAACLAAPEQNSAEVQQPPEGPTDSERCAAATSATNKYRRAEQP